ncbi:hypothetical protein [Deinococcus sonorensis]|uniref:SMI1/KNR4 family protein n=1 Tax=Deinococcus sonorensis TaxID=309891 RepID=A0ABV8YCT2_9DEIO
MTSDAITTLLSIASAALTSEPPTDIPGGPFHLRDELLAILADRNGFYALEGALHVLPASAGESGLIHWNSHDLWRGAYGELADGLLFFAQDVFGNQFALREDGVVLFNVETGDQELVATTLAGWAEAVRAEDYWTGWSLAHAWQVRHGALPVGKRLLPVQLFVLGGTFDIANLRAVGAVDSLRFRGDVARQIKDLPDGGRIHLRVVPHD